MGEPMGGAPSREDREAMREALDNATASPKSLLISQEGVAFEMIVDGERAVRLYADGRKNKGATGIERRTKWDEDRLVTESKVAGGPGGAVKFTETWTIVPSPASTSAAPASETLGSSTRLAITTRLEGGPFEKAVVIRRVYERAAAP